MPSISRIILLCAATHLVSSATLPQDRRQADPNCKWLRLSGSTLTGVDCNPDRTNKAFIGGIFENIWQADLNGCMFNNVGELSYGGADGFASCKNCGLNKGLTSLNCECYTSSDVGEFGQTKSTSIGFGVFGQELTSAPFGVGAFLGNNGCNVVDLTGGFFIPDDASSV